VFGANSIFIDGTVCADECFSESAKLNMLGCAPRPSNLLLMRSSDSLVASAGSKVDRYLLSRRLLAIIL